MTSRDRKKLERSLRRTAESYARLAQHELVILENLPFEPERHVNNAQFLTEQSEFYNNLITQLGDADGTTDA